DQLADGCPRVARVPAERTLQLEAARIAQRPVPQLHVRALHLRAAREQAVDLGEREQAHALRREVVGDREQAREESGVVARDLIGQAWIGADDHQAERRLELAQRGLDLTLLEMRVAARGAREAALEARALEGREGG